MAGLKALLTCSPFVMGGQMTHADFFATFTFSLAGLVARKVYNWDLVAEVPGLGETLARLNARDSAKVINADMKAAMGAFQAQMARQRA